MSRGEIRRVLLKAGLSLPAVTSLIEALPPTDDEASRFESDSCLSPGERQLVGRFLWEIRELLEQDRAFSDDDA